MVNIRVVQVGVLLAALSFSAGCGGEARTGDDAGLPGADAAPVDASSPPDATATPEDAQAASDAGAALAPPDVAGPYTVATTAASITRDGRTTPITAHLPQGAGPAPVVLFLPGFQLDSARYAGHAARIASHGFVVVRADPPATLLSTDHVAMTADARAVLDWATAPSGPLAGLVDPDLIAVMGHSLGGKIATMVAAGDPRVDALLGLDPVNGAGGPGSTYSATRPDIVPELVATLAMPVGFMGETTNSTGFMPCAPADQNFQTFFDAATAAPWAAEWDITGADHMDFMDDPSTCGFTCSACPDGPADDAAVRDIVRTLAVAFVRRHLRGELAMEPWLTGPQLPVGVVLDHR
jgi:predicted dienelactone hydrolase